MSATTRKNHITYDTWTTIHPLGPEDSAAITALRSMVAEAQSSSSTLSGVKL